MCLQANVVYSLKEGCVRHQTASGEDQERRKRNYYYSYSSRNRLTRVELDCLMAFTLKSL